MPPSKYSKAVLLVDDDPDHRVIYARHLKGCGFEVAVAETAEMAVAIAATGRIGCVVSDQVMPVEGAEVWSAIRAVRSDIGIVFLSSEPRAVDVPEAQVVSKGDPELLCEVVKAAMREWLNASA